MSSAVLERATTEDQLLATVCDALFRLNWRFHHIRRSDKGQQMGQNGIPDVIAVKGRRLLFVELKREDGKLSRDQKLWITDLQTVAYHLPVAYVVPETWLVKPSTLDVFLDSISRDRTSK